MARVIEWVRGVLRQARPIVDGTIVVGRLVPTVSRRLGLQLLAATLLVGAVPVGLGVTSGLLVAKVPRVAAGLRGGTESGSVVWLLVALGVLLVFMELAGQWLGLVSRTLGRRVDGDLRRRALGASLSPVGISHLEDPQLREVFGASRNLSPFAFTPGDAVQQLGPAMASRAQSLLGIAVIAVFVPLLAPAILVVWLVTQVLALVMVVRITSSAIGMVGEDALYLRDLVLTASAAKEVRVFGLGSWLSGRFTGLARERLELALARRRGQNRWYLAAASVAGGGLFGALVWVGLEGTEGKLSLAAVAIVAAVLLGVFQVPNVILDIPIAYGMFAVPAIADAENAAAVSGLPVVVKSEVDLLSAPARSIEFRDVRFTYPRSARAVLDGMDLEIPAGQRLAIVGLNGSGKTTLIKVLCRLYDPSAGTVLIDGVDLRDLDPAAWRARLAVLFQDFIHYGLSVRDNVFLGAGPEAAERLEAAAHAAGAAPLIGSLPAGWETPLSSGFSGGIDLSGGQWQRIALARALYAVGTDARLLVLDEPTANLDPRGEQEFYDLVLNSPRLRAGNNDDPTTTILISHRFATVRHADRICVLSEGRITEDGTHDELVERGGRYQELFDAQASAFRERSR